MLHQQTKNLFSQIRFQPNQSAVDSWAAQKDVEQHVRQLLLPSSVLLQPLLEQAKTCIQRSSGSIPLLSNRCINKTGKKKATKSPETTNLPSKNPTYSSPSRTREKILKDKPALSRASTAKIDAREMQNILKQKRARCKHWSFNRHQQLQSKTRNEKTRKKKPSTPV